MKEGSLITVGRSFIDASSVATVFIIVYTIIRVVDGIIVVPWIMLNVRTLPQRTRSTVLSYRTFFGGIITFAVVILLDGF